MGLARSNPSSAEKGFKMIKGDLDYFLGAFWFFVRVDFPEHRLVLTLTYHNTFAESVARVTFLDIMS